MSNAPGGFLPPLDPNQGSGTSSMSRVMLTASLMLVAWMGVQTCGPKPTPKVTEKDAPAQTTTTTQATTADAAAPTPTGTPNSLPETTKTFSADVAKAGGASDRGGDIIGGYDATVTSWGGQISRFVLPEYKENRLKKKEDLAGAVNVNLARARNQGAQFGALRSRGGDVVLAADAPYEVVQETADSVVLSRLTPSGVRVTRAWTFNAASFAVEHTLTLKNESADKKTAELDVVLTGAERVGERDEGGFFSAGSVDRLGGACDVNDKRHHFLSKKVQDDPEDFAFKGLVKTAAIDRHYFIAAVSFEGTPTDGCSASFFQ